MALEDRTEPATPKRREEARKRGEVARSPELASAAVLIAGLYALRSSGLRLFEGMQDVARLHLGELSALNLTEAGVRELFVGLLGRLTSMLLPVLLVLAGTALVANAAQVGLLLSSKPLTPDLSRIDPIKGFQRLLSGRSFMELGKTTLKAALVGVVLVRVLRASLPQLAGLHGADFATTLGVAGSTAWEMARQTALVLVLLGALDYVFQRRQYEARLRMTKQEVKEELRQMEGDPLVKSKMRQRQREMARGRMMQDVPTASVVVTNPTHLAVALLYEREMASPRVVAKGQRLMAQRIREVAAAYKVPIVENKPLARSLFDQVEVGESIPPELYRAVAEVLAYVYRLSGRAADLVGAEAGA